MPWITAAVGSDSIESVSKQIIFCAERFLAFKRLSPDYFPLAAKQTKTSQQSVMCIRPGKFTRPLGMRGWRAHSLAILNGHCCRLGLWESEKLLLVSFQPRQNTHSTTSTFLFSQARVRGVAGTAHDPCTNDRRTNEIFCVTSIAVL